MCGGWSRKQNNGNLLAIGGELELPLELMSADPFCCGFLEVLRRTLPTSRSGVVEFWLGNLFFCVVIQSPRISQTETLYLSNLCFLFLDIANSS